jgi:hypothetical protein
MPDQARRWPAPQDRTPGPWQALMVAGRACVIELTHHSQVADYTRPPDAVLMAAAPDLLAVAQQFLALWQDGFEDEEAHADLARHAAEAVAKATGPAYVRPWPTTD